MINYSGGARVVFVGDSITAGGWPFTTGGYVDQVNGQFNVTSQVRPATLGVGSTIATLVGGARSSFVQAVSFHKNIVTVNSGQAGESTFTLMSVVAPRITDYNPDVVVLLIGINDIIGLVARNTIKTQYASILSQIRAWSSTVQIACIGVLCHWEQWAAGPVWANDLDTAIDNTNSDINELCGTYNCTYMDFRAAFLAYETTHNTPAPGVAAGVLLQTDGFGIHPNATGWVLMGTTGMTYSTVTQ